MYARAFGRYVCSKKSVIAMALTAHMTVNSNQYVEANAPGASAFSPSCTYRVVSAEPTPRIRTAALLPSRSWSRRYLEARAARGSVAACSVFISLRCTAQTWSGALRTSKKNAVAKTNIAHGEDAWIEATLT